MMTGEMAVEVVSQDKGDEKDEGRNYDPHHGYSFFSRRFFR
jgi:hypothetical protein